MATNLPFTYWTRDGAETHITVRRPGDGFDAADVAGAVRARDQYGAIYINLCGEWFGPVGTKEAR